MSKKQAPKDFFADPATYVTANGEVFINNSRMLLNKCKKPDSKQFKKLAMYTAIGFSALGAIGYIVKAVSIPITSYLLS